MLCIGYRIWHLYGLSFWTTDEDFFVLIFIICTDRIFVHSQEKLIRDCDGASKHITEIFHAVHSG